MHLYRFSTPKPKSKNLPIMKKTSSLKIVAASLAAALTGIMASSAQTIYLLDWEAPSTTPGYDQADPGAITSLSTLPNGPGGSNARNITFDTTGSPFSISYFNTFNATHVNAPTSNSASDYVLSFDVIAVGLADGGVGYGQFQVTINDAVFNYEFSATDSFQQITIALSDMNLISGTFELADFSTGPQEWYFNQLGISQVDRYGEKPGNVVIVDNISITQVPEPGAMALLAFSGATVLLLRRRRMD